MKTLLFTVLIFLATSAMAASVVGVGSLAGAGVIGGTNSDSTSIAGAGIITASTVRLNPNGAIGASGTVSTASGMNISTPNADGGYLAGSIGGSGAGGFTSGNAVPSPAPVPFFAVPVIFP